MKEEQKNQLRLGLDIKSLKNHEFTAQLYVVYDSNPDVGMKKFISSPSQAITNPKAQIQLNNCFRSYMFQSTRQQLREKLAKSLSIKLFHKDRIKSDVLLGIAKLQIKQVCDQPYRKTKDSYALVYDVILPIDEVNEIEDPIKKIGELRVIVYLEDLGPVSLLKQRGFDIKNFIEEGDYHENNVEIPQPALPSQKLGGQMNEKGSLQLQDLQRKVVWELQVWKKAEQAKTRISLKQKQAEFWTNLSEQQRKSDLQKQKQFKKMQANLGLIENKLKSKMNELVKREQKLVICEQEVQNKIGEISKQVFYKDEEIERLKKRQKQQKTNLIKEKSNLELEMSKLRAQNARLRVQLQEARKEDEKAPVNILKNEINHKSMEIKELKKELQNCLQIKEEFKAYYERMKTQVIQVRAKLQEKSDQLRTSQHENALLRNNIKHLEQQINSIRQQQYYANQQNSYQNRDWDEEEEGEELGERERLIRLRRQLIEGGSYTADDPLIREYDRRIASL